MDKINQPKVKREVDVYVLQSNGLFGILGMEPEYMTHPAYPNEGLGGIRVLNISTGEHCLKKLYTNTKGVHFKHTTSDSRGTHYLSEFERNLYVEYIPYQTKLATMQHYRIA